MYKRILMALMLLWLSFVVQPLSAAALSTFTIETANGAITVTQDIPAEFIGTYRPVANSLQKGALSLARGRNFVSSHWSIKESTLSKFTWGVVIKDKEIDAEKVTPPNTAYRPYNKMRLILQYEDGSLEAMSMYRAESEQFGTRIVIGRYVKQVGKQK